MEKVGDKKKSTSISQIWQMPQNTLRLLI